MRRRESVFGNPLELKFERSQIGSEGRPEILSPESEFDRGLQESELVSGVVAFPFEEVAVDRVGR
jgi:hypothetical protein